MRPFLIEVGGMDRNRAERNIRAGLRAAALALFVFGACFYFAILYVA